MAQLDIIVLVIAAWGAYRGWKHGLFKEVVSTIGFIVGLFIAYQLYETFGDLLAPYISAHSTVAPVLGRLLAFIVLWVVTPILLGFVATLLTKTLKGLHVGLLNSLAGMLLGMAKYVLLLSCIFCAMDALHIINEEKKENSHLYQPVTAVAQTVFENVKWYAAKRTDGDVKADTVWIPIHHDVSNESPKR